MKARLLMLLVAGVLWAVSSIEARQTFDKGFDFRQNQAYVTDPAGSTYVLEATAYPTTRNGVTFGWTVNPDGCRDRSTTVDPRIAGVCFGNGAGTFRVDLPAVGDYEIRLAMGDATNAQNGSQVLIKDNTTTKITLGPSNPAGDGHYDATGAYYLNAAWPGSNSPSTVTFASTTLFLTLEAGAPNSVISHLHVSQVDGGGGAPSSRKRRLLMGIGE